MIRLIAGLAGIFYLLTFLSHIYSVSNSSDLIIYFLDVGQGDSIVISSNSETLVIDGGPSYDSSDFVYSLSSFDSCASTSLLLTHPHYDHLAGLNRILSFCTPKAVYTTTVEYKSKSFQQFKATTAGLNTVYLELGDEFSVGEVQFYVLWPSLERLKTKLKGKIG